LRRDQKKGARTLSGGRASKGEEKISEITNIPEGKGVKKGKASRCFISQEQQQKSHASSLLNPERSGRRKTISSLRKRGKKKGGLNLRYLLNLRSSFPKPGEGGEIEKGKSYLTREYTMRSLNSTIIGLVEDETSIGPTTRTARGEIRTLH